MYRNGSDYSEKQDLMNRLLEQKITEFRVYYDEIKRENPESRFVLIVGRSPPPFEALLETKASHRDFFNGGRRMVSRAVALRTDAAHLLDCCRISSFAVSGFISE